MSDPAYVMAALREEWRAAGHVRRPTEAGPPAGKPYPLIIEPLEGAPAPGELADELVDHTELVLSLVYAGALAEERGQTSAARQRMVIDLRYRADGNPALRAAMALDGELVKRLIRPETNYGAGFQIGIAAPLWVLQVTAGARMAPISRARGRAFDHLTKLEVEVLAP
jgi:hypothetical protein